VQLTASLPEPSDERVAVHVRKAAIREIRSGHPWIWDGSIERQSKPGEPGDLAVIFDDKRDFAAIGLLDPGSPISVRVLHQGKPRTIDDAFFAERVLEAVARRQPLIDDPNTTGYRLVHGENDRLPGLVVDRYADSLVVRIDTIAWLPHLRSVLAPVLELTEPDRVVLRASRRISGSLPADLSDGATLLGDPPDGPIVFRENGLIFEADIERGQKTGHFLDQRANRLLVGQRCRDADVLDMFCNTGGFSVHAAAGGARSVHSVDLSPHAVEATRHHMELNRTELGFEAEHTFAVADAFDALEALTDRRARFDVVVVDPPSFAPNAASVPGARRAYRRLTALAIQLLGSGGTLFQASCSSRIEALDFHDLIADELDMAGFKATDEVRTAHTIDHPIAFAEGAYLKATLADITRRR
jgi:23S rRNA (cytosine1962-C5)-methyltransferase